jgi:hypothetical protein
VPRWGKRLRFILVNSWLHGPTMRWKPQCLLPGESMAHWTFSIKFAYDTQFIFRCLMFVIGENGNLELLSRGPALRHPAPMYGTTPYYPTNPCMLGGAYSGLNPHVGPYYLSAMTSQGRPIGKTILQSAAGASSSSSSGATPDWDSIEDYPEIVGSVC